MRGAVRELSRETSRAGQRLMRTWTRAHYNAAWKKSYAKNAARKMAWQKRRRDETRRWFRALKTALHCARCGETAPECLQFHHRDPKAKDIDLTTAIFNGWSRERIVKEIEKCDVLCANCHLKHH